MALPFPTSTAPVALPARPARPHLVVLEGGAGAGPTAGARRPSPQTYLRRRLLVAAVAGLVVASALGLWRASAPAPTGPAVATSYAVAPGDTLWSIVERLGIEGDRQQIVARLGEVNGGTVIRPGVRLVIPADVAARRS